MSSLQNIVPPSFDDETPLAVPADDKACRVVKEAEEAIIHVTDDLAKSATRPHWIKAMDTTWEHLVCFIPMVTTSFC